MKKLTVGLTVLLCGYAANSLAALPGGTSRFNVCVPSYCGGFTFGLTGLYWRPSTDHLDFALTYPTADLHDDGCSFTNGRYHSVDDDYNWGFKANVGYIFPCSGNDINLTYTHWDEDDSEHVNKNDSTLIFPTATDFPSASFGSVAFTGCAEQLQRGKLDLTAIAPIIITATADDLVAVSARSNFENHTWDLDFGQTINVGCNFTLRWFGGLRYSRLEHDLDVTHEFAINKERCCLEPCLVDMSLCSKSDASSESDTSKPKVLYGTALITPVVDIAATIRDVVSQKSEFDGIGPRFGIDASYHISCGFGVVGSLSTSLLVGEHEATFSERIETEGTVTIPSTKAIGVAVIDQPRGVTVIEPEITGPRCPIVLSPTNPTQECNFKHPDETRVVPNIDAKLGLDWTYQFCNCSRSRLTIEAGYLVSHYFNATDRLSQVGIVSPEFRTRHTIDASFDGPYVGVQVAL